MRIYAGKSSNRRTKFEILLLWKNITSNHKCSSVLVSALSNNVGILASIFDIMLSSKDISEKGGIPEENDV